MDFYVGVLVGMAMMSFVCTVAIVAVVWMRGIVSAPRIEEHVAAKTEESTMAKASQSMPRVVIGPSSNTNEAPTPKFNIEDIKIESSFTGKRIGEISR